VSSDPFVHLHVASGYSLRYGASHPQVLVQRAVEHGMDTLALTDRDGLYGVVRFAKACMSAGVRPILGVDLAIEPSGLLPAVPVHPLSTRPFRRSPAWPRHGRPRSVAVAIAMPVAAGHVARRQQAGLVGAVPSGVRDQPAGERGDPVTTLELLAEHVSGRDVLVLLGPASEVGWAAAVRRDDLADQVLRRWRGVVDRPDLMVEVVSHRCAGSGPGSSPHAGRMARIADAVGLDVVLTNAVRYADPLDAPTVDVLDAVRRLVPLDPRHVDRGNAEGFLKSGKQMAEIAEEICRFAGFDDRESRRLLARTHTVADRCAVDPRRDLGLGEVHFPEFPVEGSSADAVLRARCEAGLGRRYGSGSGRGANRGTGHGVSGETLTRLDDELRAITQLGYASYFLTVGDVCDLIRDMGVRVRPRGSGAGSLVNYLLGISGVDPMRHGLLMERFLSPLRQALPDIDIDVESERRTEVYEQILQRYGGDRCTCVSMMDTYRVRHAIRDVGSALGMPPGRSTRSPRRSRTSGPGTPRGLARAAGASRLRVPAGTRGYIIRPVLPPGGEARRPATSRCPASVRRAALRCHAARPHPGRSQLRRFPDEPVRQGRRRGSRDCSSSTCSASACSPRWLTHCRRSSGSTARSSTSTTRRRCPSTTRRRSR
jgi:error-prone DNA polymerase